MNVGCPCAYRCFTNELGCPCAYQCFTNELGCPCAYQSFTNEHRCNVCTLITPLPENKLETPEEDTWCHEKGLWNYELVKAGRILWLHLASVSWDKCNVPGCLRILFCWLPARCSTEGSHKHGKGPDSIIIIIIIITPVYLLLPDQGLFTVLPKLCDCTVPIKCFRFLHYNIQGVSRL